MQRSKCSVLCQLSVQNISFFSASVGYTPEKGPGLVNGSVHVVCHVNLCPSS